MMSTDQERLKRIVELRKQDMTYEQIGKELGGISKQRIEQLLKHMTPEERKLFGHRPPKVVVSTCLQCGEEIKYKKARIFCGKKCAIVYLGNSKRIYPETKGMTPSQAQNWVYHNVPGKREKHNLAVRKNRERVLKDPKRAAHYRHLQSIVSKRHYLKRKAERHGDKQTSE